jgi:hypothetical protein
MCKCTKARALDYSQIRPNKLKPQASSVFITYYYQASTICINKSYQNLTVRTEKSVFAINIHLI